MLNVVWCDSQQAELDLWWTKKWTDTDSFHSVKSLYSQNRQILAQHVRMNTLVQHQCPVVWWDYEPGLG